MMKINVEMTFEQLNELPLSCNKCKMTFNFADLIRHSHNKKMFIHTSVSNSSLVLCHFCLKNNEFNVSKMGENGYIHLNIDELFHYNLYIIDDELVIFMENCKSKFNLRELDVDIIKLT